MAERTRIFFSDFLSFFFRFFPFFWPNRLQIIHLPYLLPDAGAYFVYCSRVRIKCIKNSAPPRVPSVGLFLLLVPFVIGGSIRSYLRSSLLAEKWHLLVCLLCTILAFLLFYYKYHTFIKGVEREDCFGEAEGLEFLTSEVGLEPGSLEEQGAEIAALVGYQKVRWIHTTHNQPHSA